VTAEKCNTCKRVPWKGGSWGEVTTRGDRFISLWERKNTVAPAASVEEGRRSEDCLSFCLRIRCSLSLRLHEEWQRKHALQGSVVDAAFIFLSLFFLFCLLPHSSSLMYSISIVFLVCVSVSHRFVDSPREILWLFV